MLNKLIENAQLRFDTLFGEEYYFDEDLGNEGLFPDKEKLKEFISKELHTLIEEVIKIAEGKKGYKYDKEKMEKLWELINSAPFPLVALNHSLQNRYDSALESLITSLRQELK